MDIKLDENLSRHLKDQLLPLGHNVSTAFEEGLLGKVDVEDILDKIFNDFCIGK